MSSKKRNIYREIVCEVERKRRGKKKVKKRVRRNRRVRESDSAKVTQTDEFPALKMLLTFLRRKKKTIHYQYYFWSRKIRKVEIKQKKKI